MACGAQWPAHSQWSRSAPPGTTPRLLAALSFQPAMLSTQHSEGAASALLSTCTAHDIIPTSVVAAVLAVSCNSPMLQQWEDLMMFRVLAAAGVATVLVVPGSANAQVLMQRDVSVKMAL